MIKPRFSPTALLLAVVLVTAGCARPSEKPADQPAPPLSRAEPNHEPLIPETPGPSPGDLPLTASLFPATDWELTFDIWDLGAAEAVRPEEQWIREGNRLVMASDGKPYATWHFDGSGVWRLDPKGGGALLRYLPPTLKDDETWRQTSGDAEVWFSLTRDNSVCPASKGDYIDAGQCWTLTVLNRGELTTFRFAPNLGPTSAKAVNYTEPSTSFYKEVRANQAGRLSATDRKSLLDQAPTPTAQRAAVIPATATDFAAARQTLPSISTVRADLDGDGQQETLRGPIDTWTKSDIEVLDADGNLLTVSQTWGGQEQRVSLVRFRGAGQPFVLMENRGGRDFPSMTIARLTRSENRWWLMPSQGWDVKSPGTTASRVTTVQDGLVTVEWDMGDPARHTRVRQYRFDPVEFQARWETETFRAEGPELRHPSDPLELLQAAFVARWFGLSDELPRYFATEEAAAAFQAHKEISEPNYRPGEVRFAAVTEGTPMCYPPSTPATLDSANTVPFLATWGGYEWAAGAWGKVTFTQDGQGRPIIQQLTVEGSCGDGH